jgi:hypothetical protein
MQPQLVEQTGAATAVMSELYATVTLTLCTVRRLIHTYDKYESIMKHVPQFQSLLPPCLGPFSALE